MGFKYTHRVYHDVHDTTATEQQVLALLAHFVDDKTGLCYPSIETLARQSHLSRATIMRNLDSLKQKGYLKWISGGRKKKGRVLSNLYKLTLPKPAPKREETELAEFWEDVDNSKSRVSQCDPYPSHSETPHRLTVRPLPVSQCDPIIYRSSKDHPGDHHPPSAGEVPGRFELGVARRDGTLDQILQEVTASVQTTKRTESQSIVQMAMDAAETHDIEDRKTFSHVMLRKNPDDCREAIYQFESERRAGEMDKIRSLPALLTKRLSSLPDRSDQ
ncbi:MAG: helix-turn-helix domain-containing protein [Bacteroidales bacterium]|nr:helix-turn-helix domain-containing protein [Bacteroidales bacterium]